MDTETDLLAAGVSEAVGMNFVNVEVKIITSTDSAMFDQKVYCST